ncbi:hypothetical protein GEMRC1_007237 [Eukaryota sp. GEM-RC1]
MQLLVFLHHHQSLDSIRPSELLFDSSILDHQDSDSTLFDATWLGKEVSVRVVFYSDIASKQSILQHLFSLSQLRHHYLANMYGVCVFGSGHVLVVTERVKPLLPLPSSLSLESLSYALEITEALDYLHSRSFIHGDLTPQSIYTVTGTIKLFGYGFQPKITQFNFSNFSAPEVFLDRVLLFESDIFSLGLVFFELFFGQLSSFHLNSRDSYEQRLTNTFLQFPPTVPKSLKNLIVSCCNISPSKRPSLKHVKSVLNQLSADFVLNSTADSIVFAQSVSTSKRIRILEKAVQQQVDRRNELVYKNGMMSKEVDQCQEKISHLLEENQKLKSDLEHFNMSFSEIQVLNSQLSLHKQAFKNSLTN